MESCYKTFVSVGNAKQHFSRLLNAVEAIAHLLPQPVLIQCGHTPFVSKHCTVKDFINMDVFVQYVANAEIMILHAGAGSVLHTIKSGKCPIVMPRRAQFGEHVNDHQLGFASTLQATNKVIMIEDDHELIQALDKVRQHNPSSLLNHRPKALDIIEDKIKYLLGEK